MCVISLSNHLLIKAYNKAIDLQLDPQFIDLLEKEIKKRDLSSISDNINELKSN